MFHPNLGQGGRQKKLGISGCLWHVLQSSHAMLGEKRKQKDVNSASNIFGHVSQIELSVWEFRWRSAQRKRRREGTSVGFDPTKILSFIIPDLHGNPEAHEVLREHKIIASEAPISV